MLPLDTQEGSTMELLLELGPPPHKLMLGQIKHDAWLRVKDTRLLAVLDWNPSLFGPCVGS